MAFGFLIDRAGLVVQGQAPRAGALWIGVAFVALGVVLSGLSALQYRRALASLRPVEIPPGYWVNLSVLMSALVALLGLALAAYLVTDDGGRRANDGYWFRVAKRPVPAPPSLKDAISALKSASGIGLAK